MTPALSPQTRCPSSNAVPLATRHHRSIALSEQQNTWKILSFITSFLVLSGRETFGKERSLVFWGEAIVESVRPGAVC